MDEEEFYSLLDDTELEEYFETLEEQEEYNSNKKKENKEI